MSDGQQLLDVGCRGEESWSAVVTGCNYTKLALKKHRHTQFSERYENTCLSLETFKTAPFLSEESLAKRNK